MKILLQSENAPDKRRKNFCEPKTHRGSDENTFAVRKRFGDATKILLQVENTPGEAMRVFPYHKIAARTRHKANGLRRDVAKRIGEAFRAGHGKAGMSRLVMSFLGFLYEEVADDVRT